MVAIVVAAGILSVAYVEYNAHHLPIHSSNTVVNETVAENFLAENSLNASVYNFNATTHFSYHSIGSSLTMRMLNFSPFYMQLESPLPVVFVQLAIIVTGNIMTGLNPSGVLVSVSDKAHYNNSDVTATPYVAQPYPPYSNVTPPSASTFGNTAGFGNFTIHSLFKLIKQKSTSILSRFALLVVFHVRFPVYPNQNSIGTHILRVTASLQGLGVSVFAGINVLLIDKS